MNSDVQRTILSALLAMALAGGAVAHNGDDDEDEFRARGNGIYLLTTQGGSEIEVKFAFDGRQELEFQGLPIEFRGEVTCLSVDPENGRVWVGGVVTRNDSVHPGFTTEIHEPGRDVWFRVLDTGRGADEADRTTFLGFEGGGGIITSEEYCDLQPWPDDNARTHPVIEGKIRLRIDDD